MKRYKKLQHIVNESLAKNRDEQLLKSLKIQNERLNNAKRKSRQQSFRFAKLSSCLAVVLIIAIIGGLFLFKDDTRREEYAYLEEYSVQSTVEDLNSFTDFIDLNKKIEWRVKKFSDKIYNHTLYFIVDGENFETFETFSITIIVNEKYNYKDTNMRYNSKYSLLSYDLLYFEKFNIDDDGIYTFVNHGKIITQKETLYINYESIGFNETSNFIPSISNLLIFS